MNTKKQVLTKGYPIAVPLDEYYTCPCVMKIYFGKKYLIWKGKSLFQSCESIGKQLEKPVSTKILPDDTSYLYHLVVHIIKTRCLSGIATIIEYNKPPLQLLKTEQRELDKAKNDQNCLNNNIQAYVPVSTHFISESDKQKFLTWYELRNKK